MDSKSDYKPLEEKVCGGVKSFVIPTWAIVKRMVEKKNGR